MRTAERQGHQSEAPEQRRTPSGRPEVLGDVTARLDVGTGLDPTEREALLKRVRAYEQAPTEQVEKLRVQLARAVDFAATLRGRPPNTDGC